MQTLLKLEKEGWEALSSEGDASRQFYEIVLHDNALMLFAGGLLIQGKEQVLASLGTQPWETYTITDPQTVSLSEDAGLLVYQVTAKREGEPPYEALISSTYIFNDGRWQLIHHQHTPV